MLAIAHAAIAAADPSTLTKRALTPEAESRLGDGPVRLIAAGKASAAMARAFLSARPRLLASACIVGIGPAGRWPSNITWHGGGHPVPTQASVDAGLSALALASRAGSQELLVVLLSGGASSLMAVPAGGLSLGDKQQTTRRLLEQGAGIWELNAVRKHLSGIKGGRLAAAAPGRVHSMIISDVVGDDLSVIGSGPTVADPTTYRDALDVLDAHGGRSRYPRAAVRVLERGAAGELAETPKPGGTSLRESTTVLIGGSHDAMEGARLEAVRRGYHVHVCDAPIVGEARTAAHAHARRLQELVAKSERPLCVVSGGETTVKVVGSGSGGRNQEFALALAAPLRELGCPAAAISIGTDGIDGPTDAAGAVVDDTTLDRARAAGIGDPITYLTNNDTYRFFRAMGDLVVIGPTGTNVGDIQVVALAGGTSQHGGIAP